MINTSNENRLVIFDTETTGFCNEAGQSPAKGHRVIEIGCVEVINRQITGRQFHEYINPEQEIDIDATNVHGLTYADLLDKPKFAQIADKFLEFIQNAELIAHNANFDINFINKELKNYNPSLKLSNKVTDSWALAKELHPGQQISLDALCRKYNINNTNRIKHGALLDAELLAEVYLTMTGGQINFDLSFNSNINDINKPIDTTGLKIIKACATEIEAHEKHLDFIEKKSTTIWRSE